MNSGQIVVNMLSTAKERGRLGKRVEGEVRKKERGRRGREGRASPCSDFTILPLPMYRVVYRCRRDVLISTDTSTHRSDDGVRVTVAVTSYKREGVKVVSMSKWTS